MFPRREWLRSSARATAALPDAAFAYGDMRGAIELRTALASYLGRVRSIATTVDQVLIVNGFAQTLACVAQLLARDERVDGASPAVIACEDPGSKGAVDQLTWWGLDVVRVPVDHEGIDVVGFNVWSLTDNYEWGTFSPRFGLFRVECRDKNFTRVPTDGVQALVDVIANRGVTQQMAAAAAQAKHGIQPA